MSRIEKERVDLDYEATLAFFRKRGERGRALGAVQATAYQDQQPDLALRRNEAEKTRVLPLLEPLAGKRVLDLGCGTGRWADELSSDVGAYLGIDYAAELLDLARERLADAHPRVQFQELSAAQVGDVPLDVAPPFDRILVSGLCIYLNDDDLEHMFRALPRLCAGSAVVYVREPVSLLAHRMTLKEHYSEELDAEYNAIYRTDPELRELLERTLGSGGFELAEGGEIYPPELNNRRETRQHYFLLTRGSS